MSKQRYECKRIGLDCFDRAPIRIVSAVELPCSPEELFAHFEDADAWAVWVDVIKDVQWTSPRPFAVGTTRSVEMPGGMVAYEEFLAWDAPRHMAFRFNQFTQKFLKAFGENYEVTDLGDGRCRLVWTVGMEPAGPAAFVLPLFKPVLARNLRKIMSELKKYVESHD